MQDIAQMWLNRLQNGDCSAETYEEFEQWMAEDEAHKSAFEKVKRLEIRIDAIADNDAILRLQREVLERTAPKPVDTKASGDPVGSTSQAAGLWRRLRAILLPPRASSPAAWGALTCCVVLGFALAWWLPQVRNTHSTAVGEQRTMTLAEGSVMTLDTDSKVRVDYGDTERRVLLLRGRAYFDVVSSPESPFVVQTHAGEVKAIGTAFSVQRRPGGLQVILREGVVEVAAGENAAARAVETLSPGEQLTYDSQSGLTRQISENLEQQMSWVSGQLEFRGTRFADVVAEVNRYSESSIRLVSPELHSLEVNAVFKVGEMDTFVLALQSGFDLTATRRLNGDIDLIAKNK